MQADLKIRFSVCIRLVDRIAFPTTRGRNRTSGVRVLDGQLAPFF
jgi:hypothetical protein